MVVPNPNTERMRNYGILRKQERQDYWYEAIGNSSISINNVEFVDGLKHNLLSISQFCDSGYEVVFDKNTCQ